MHTSPLIDFKGNLLHTLMGSIWLPSDTLLPSNGGPYFFMAAPQAEHTLVKAPGGPLNSWQLIPLQLSIAPKASPPSSDLPLLRPLSSKYSSPPWAHGSAQPSSYKFRPWASTKHAAHLCKPILAPPQLHGSPGLRWQPFPSSLLSYLHTGSPYTHKDLMILSLSRPFFMPLISLPYTGAFATSSRLLFHATPSQASPWRPSVPVNTPATPKKLLHCSRYCLLKPLMPPMATLQSNGDLRPRFPSISAGPPWLWWLHNVCNNPPGNCALNWQHPDQLQLLGNSSSSSYTLSP
ncbi:hypothetical protein L7F22_008239 [Adiantum nelumboides]|nr:hypothetical protein [Adiantum nelumboides]